MRVSTTILLAVLMTAPLAQPQTRIMPVGDSITKGVGGSGDNRGYRKPLYNLLKNSYSVDFVGSQVHGDGTFDENHEGHPGETAEFIKGNISNFLSAANPNIVILHIGTNDISDGVATNDIVSDIDVTLTRIWNFNPGVQVLLCSVAPRISNDPATQQLGQGIQNLVSSRSSNNPVTFVDIYQTISWREGWEKFAMADSVHPNDTGYQLMADALFETLRPLLTLVTPVELAAFTANAFENRVLLQWSTASETNNYGFEIEHSTGGAPFSRIGFVAGNGTTLRPEEYSFQHLDPKAGKNFYRLRQIDSDGAFSFSPIVEAVISHPQEFSLAAAYPNPFSLQTSAGAATFEFKIPESTQIRVTVFDLLGRQVAQLFSGEKPAGAHKIAWNGTNQTGGAVNPGVYIISLQTPQGVKYQKLTVTR